MPGCSIYSTADNHKLNSKYIAQIRLTTDQFSTSTSQNSKLMIFKIVVPLFSVRISGTQSNFLTRSVTVVMRPFAVSTAATCYRM